METYLFLGGSAAVIALVVTPLVRLLALRIGVVDEPGGRRVHQGAVPRLGGVAVLVAGVGALVLARALGLEVFAVLLSYGWSLQWLLAGTLLMVAVGVADDVWGLGPAPKLAVEILAAFMALAGGYGFTAVTNPFTGGYIQLGTLGGLFTLLWVVGITNAFNLIDGLDGLAAGTGLIASVTLLVVSLIEGRPDATLLAATVAGALAGFLYFNFSPASIFLGDSGSLLLGYLLAVVSVQSLQKGATTVVIIAPILALGLPILDTLLAVARRFLVSGFASIFRADQEHIHHRLVDMGMTQRRAVLVLYAVCVALGLMAFLAVTVRGLGKGVVVGVLALATYVAVRKLGYPLHRSGPPLGAAAARRALIYGAGASAVVQRLSRNGGIDCQFIGIVDDRPSLWGQEVDGIRVLGGGEQLGEIIRAHGASLIWVASDGIEPGRLEMATAACRAAGAEVRCVTLNAE